MRDTSLLQLALGPAPPRTVAGRDFDAEARRLDIHIDFTAGTSPARVAVLPIARARHRMADVAVFGRARQSSSSFATAPPEPRQVQPGVSADIVCSLRFMQGFATAAQGVIAIDGKPCADRSTRCDMLFLTVGKLSRLIDRM